MLNSHIHVHLNSLSRRVRNRQWARILSRNWDCCIAGWTAGCGEGCMKGRCEELGGTWIAKDYSLNPYTCEMGGKNFPVVNNPENVYNMTNI